LRKRPLKPCYPQNRCFIATIFLLRFSGKNYLFSIHYRIWLHRSLVCCILSTLLSFLISSIYIDKCSERPPAPVAQTHHLLRKSHPAGKKMIILPPAESISSTRYKAKNRKKGKNKPELSGFSSSVLFEELKTSSPGRNVFAARRNQTGHNVRYPNDRKENISGIKYARPEQ